MVHQPSVPAEDSAAPEAEPPRPKMTPRQQKVLAFINRFIQERGYPPTLREIGRHFGISSTNGVNDHLVALEKRGYLQRTSSKSRALRPTVGPAASRDPLGAVEVPLVGRVAAGQPLLAVEHIEQTVTIDRSLLGAKVDPSNVFALRIRGDSMIDAGIKDGDLVFVRKQAEASRGAIVVALLGDEATVKYYFPEKEHIRLQPANKRLAPILVPKDDSRQARILGVVVGMYRKVGGAEAVGAARPRTAH